MDAGGPIVAVLHVEQIGGDRDARTSRAEHQHLGPRVLPVVGREEDLQRQPGRDRVLGVAVQRAAAF